MSTNPTNISTSPTPPVNSDMKDLKDMMKQLISQVANMMIITSDEAWWTHKVNLRLYYGKLMALRQHSLELKLFLKRFWPYFF